MKSKPLNLLLTAALLLLPALPLQASVDSMLTLVLSCYTQTKITTDGTTATGKVDIVRIDSKQLLVLLEKELNTNLPRGAQLKLAADGKVYVADPKGNVLNDVSIYLHATMDEDPRLTNGRRNTVTGQENTQNYFPITFTMNFSTLQGTVRGIISEKLVVSPPDRYGVQISTGHSNSTVNGSGSLDGKLAYFNGTLKLIGKTASAPGH